MKNTRGHHTDHLDWDWPRRDMKNTSEKLGQHKALQTGTCKEMKNIKSSGLGPRGNADSVHAKVRRGGIQCESSV